MEKLSKRLIKQLSLKAKSLSQEVLKYRVELGLSQYDADKQLSKTFDILSKCLALCEGLRPLDIKELCSLLEDFEAEIYKFSKSEIFDIKSQSEKLIALNVATKFYLRAL